MKMQDFQDFVNTVFEDVMIIERILSLYLSVIFYIKLVTYFEDILKAIIMLTVNNF
jgi:hypothetical protein